MPLWLYHHSAYGYIVRAATLDEAADCLLFLVTGNPVHPPNRERLLAELARLEDAGEPRVIAEWPG
jgi:hypothetical protein